MTHADDEAPEQAKQIERALRVMQARHPDADPAVIRECVIIDAAFMAWLLERKRTENDILDYRLVWDAWRCAWVEGKLHQLAEQDDAETQERRGGSIVPIH